MSIAGKRPFYKTAAVVRDGYLYIFGGINGSWDEPNGVYDIWRTWIGE
jgi:hypothetical protein